MTRTLADMTPDEQQECVGMWGDTPTITAVIASIVTTTKGSMVRLFRPEKALTVPFMALDLVTPRLDLPRAWTPTGAPVPGEWQYHPAYTGVYQDGTTSLDLIGVETDSKQDAEWQCADIHRDDPEVHFFPVRRYVTDWEDV